MSPRVNAVAFLCLSLLAVASQTESRAVTDDEVVTLGATDPTIGLLEALQQKLESDNDDDYSLSTEVPSQNASVGTGKGLRMCFRLRLLRMLLRLLMIKASGFNIQQLQGETTSTESPAGRSTRLTDEDMEELCRELCAIGLCPPGCPGEYLPPWGKKRK